MTSETSKYRHLTRQYCYRADGEPGVGVDIASQGDPVVPWAINFDLPEREFDYYNSGHTPHGPLQLRGFAEKLPFCDNSLDFVYCSHLLEDFVEEKWPGIIHEWARCLKVGGHLIVLIPDKTLWKAAIDSGQPPNCAHKREGELGLMSHYGELEGLQLVDERLTQCHPGDYTIMYVGKRQ